MTLAHDALPEAPAAAARAPADLLAGLLAHRSAVFRVCLGFAARTADAEDLTHDVYERALRCNGRWQNPEHARRWLFLVARNAGLDYRRRQAVRRLCAPLLAEDGAETDDPSEREEQEEQIRRLKRALLRLPRRLHEVLALREYGGMACLEIAALLRLPPGTVLSRLHRAREQLRRQLEEP